MAGAVALAHGQLNEAASLVDQAWAYAQERGLKVYAPLIALAAGRASAAQGEADRALADLGEAEAGALRLGMRPLVWQGRAAAARVLAGAGRAAEAEIKRQAARAMVVEIAGLLADEDLRAAFVEHANREIASAAVQV